MFEFQPFSQKTKIDIYDYRFQRPYPDPVERSSPPTKMHLIGKHRRCRAIIDTLLRSPTTECNQTKLVIMTQSRRLQSIIALRSDDDGATTATQWNQPLTTRMRRVRRKKKKRNLRTQGRMQIYIKLPIVVLLPTFETTWLLVDTNTQYERSSIVINSN